jgi:hypothetical protein
MRRIAMLVAPVLMAGCSTLDPEVAQLERFQAAKSRSEWSKIVDEQVSTCRDACARLHAIRGEACLALGMADLAPAAACPPATDERRRLLSCAADEFKKAREASQPGGGALASDALQGIRQGRAQALYCSAELSTVAQGIALADEAQREAQGLGSPQKDLLSGWAALYLARPGAGNDQQRCAQVRRANAFAQSGLIAATDNGMRSRLQRLAQDASGRRATLAGCGG